MLRQEMSNDLVLSEAVGVVISVGRKLDELMRDAKIREVELVLGSVLKAAEKGIYRCQEMAFTDSTLPDGYRK